MCPGLHWPIGALSSQGARGVQLFFVVSALTLTLSWHARDDGVAAFYVRRLFRIVPMFWLAILIFLLLLGFDPRYWAPQGIGWPHVLVTALFLHGFHPDTMSSVVPGGWTIAVEMTFYCSFPLLVWGLRSWQIAAVALVAAMCLAILLYPVTIELLGRRLPPRARSARIAD
jgi:peptidoglycan/LPS O-acetylase OafA/YrhL